MSGSHVRQRPDGRAVWPAWKRVAVRLFRFIGGMFLNRAGTALSWSACALTLFALVEAKRLLPIPWTNGTKIVPVVGWPELFLCVLILWGRWIDDAAQKVADKDPDKIVDKVLPALIARMGIGAVAGEREPGTFEPANLGAPGGDLGD